MVGSMAAAGRYAVGAVAGNKDLDPLARGTETANWEFVWAGKAAQH